MLHVSSLDNIYHAFWKFRFPQQFPERIDPSDIQALGGVVDRYIEYLDGRIQRIVALMPREPNVIVVADHGHEASLNHALWSGWHGQFGSFAAAGPDIPRRSDPLKVSYFSIAPLILELLGFARPADFVDAPHAISLQRQ
jgi:predicted AlkP superfamily phosphohydrolase/phosphomutase